MQAKTRLEKRDAIPYRELFESLHEPLFVTDNEGTISDANHATITLFACERADFLGSHFRDLYASLDDYKRFREEIERKGFVKDFAASLRTRTGYQINVLMTASTRRSADGGYCGIIRKTGTYTYLERYIYKLRTLAAKLLIDREKERVRFGSDLHDSIGQMLVLSKVKVDSLRHSDAAGRKTLIDELEQAVDDMAHLIRSMTFDSSSPVLYGMGFIPGLAALGDILHAQYGLTVRIEVEAEWEIRDHDIRGLVYRAARELLVNVARHADTDQATVFLRREAAQLQVVVKDAGTGFDTAHLEQMIHNRHFGLFSIQEKLLYIDGHLTIKSTPGEGTRCSLTLPIKYEEEGYSP